MIWNFWICSSLKLMILLSLYQNCVDCSYWKVSLVLSLAFALKIWTPWFEIFQFSMDVGMAEKWTEISLNSIELMSYKVKVMNLRLCVLGETEAIYLINSQRNEKFFKKVWSFTGCESTVISFSIKFRMPVNSG